MNQSAEGGREREEGGREGGRERRREGGREGGRRGKREGGREGGRGGGLVKEILKMNTIPHLSDDVLLEIFILAPLCNIKYIISFG